MKNILQKYKALFHSAIKREANPSVLLTASIVACGCFWIVSVLMSLLGHAVNALSLMEMLSIPFVVLFCVLAVAYPILTLMNLKNAENNESFWMNLIVAIIWGAINLFY